MPRDVVQRTFPEVLDGCSPSPSEIKPPSYAWGLAGASGGPPTLGVAATQLETAASTRRASDAGQLWAIETPPAAIAKARLVRDARRVVALAGLRNVPGSVRSGGCSFDPRGDDGARAFTREQ